MAAPLQTNTDHIARLGLYTGIVTEVDSGSYLCFVKVDNLNEGGGQCKTGYVLSGVLGHFLGFKQCTLLPVGTRVACMPMTESTCIVLGAFQPVDFADTLRVNRAALNTGVTSTVDGKNAYAYDTDLMRTMLLNGRRASDALQGELVYENELGVMLGLFQAVACLKGSELAQVQAFVLDDLVRLVSHNFEHFTSMGQLSVKHDGASLSMEGAITHLPEESLGAPGGQQNPGLLTYTGEMTFTDDKDLVDMSQPAAEMLPRFKFWLGALGDFVNLCLCRPIAARQLAGEAPNPFDTGLAQIKVNIDGGITMRSVREVVLEKTNWIRVPARIRSDEDPQGDDLNDLQYSDKVAFVFDDRFRFSSDDPLAYALQLRDYLAYMQEDYGLKAFADRPKDFDMSTAHDDREMSIKGITQADPRSQTKYYLATSGVYLMVNGGLVFRDGFGSAIVMEGGNIYLQPAKDLVAQPTRDSISQVGRYASLRARKDIDLSSTKGGIRVKVEKAAYVYSDKSGIVLESNNESTGQRGEGEVPEEISGILFKSQTDILGQAQKNTGFSAIEGVAWLRAKEDVVCQAEEGRASLLAGQEALVYSNGNLLVKSTADVVCTAEGIFNAAGNGGTYLGIKDQELGIDLKLDITVDANYSYDYTVKGTIPPNYVTTDKVADSIDYDWQQVFSFNSADTVDNLLFKFLPSHRYQLDQSMDYIMQTFAQQQDELSGYLGLSDWQEEPINDTRPYPGSDLFSSMYVHSEITNLDFSGQAFWSRGAGLTGSSTLSTGSLSEYTVWPDN